MTNITLRGLTILVVDDEEFARQVVIRMLRDLGEPRIIQARDGPDALAALQVRTTVFDAALVDFNMPKVNGLQVLKAIRMGQTEATRGLPVALLTGHADRNLVGKALQLNANGFLVKPVSQARLRERLGRMLSEEATIQSKLAYSDIDVSGAGLPGGEDAPGAVKPPRPPAATTPPPAANGTPPAEDDAQAAMVKRSVRDIHGDAVLARDLYSTSGVRLLGKGTVVNERFLNRLRDLAELDEVDEIWVKVQPG